VRLIVVTKHRRGAFKKVLQVDMLDGKTSQNLCTNKTHVVDRTSL